MKNEPFVLIEILNLNQADMTIKCIESIIKNTNYKNYKITVIDNGSTDESVKKIKRKFGKKVLIVPLDRNYGFAVGYNKGNEILLKKFNPDYILLMNNDIIVPNNQKNWLKKLVATFNKFPNAGIVGCRLIYPNGKIQHAGVRLSYSDKHPILKHKIWIKNILEDDRGISKKIVTGAIMLIPTNIWKTLNGFDEIFYPMDAEDIDICLRMEKKIKKYPIYNGTVTLIHMEGLSREKSKNIFSKLKKSIISLSHQYIILFKYSVTKNKILDTIVSLIIFPCREKDTNLRCALLAPYRIILYNIISSIYAIYKIIKNRTIKPKNDGYEY